jgi:hypothetical protein
MGIFIDPALVNLQALVIAFHSSAFLGALWPLYGSVSFAYLFSGNRSKASSNRMTGYLLHLPHFVAHHVGKMFPSNFEFKAIGKLSGHNAKLTQSN